MTRETPSEVLSLVTANYRSWPYIKFLSLTAERLAHDGWAEWLLIDNTPREKERQKLKHLPKSRILPRSRMERWLRTAPKLPGGHIQDHASALNALYREVRTKWTLIMDADIAFLRDGWDVELIKYAEREGLDAIGAPYHPRKWQKFRGCPCVIFVLVRTRLLKEAEFDFRSHAKNPLHTLWEYLLHLTQHQIKRVYPEVIQGMSLDTGWRLRRLLKQPGVRTESFDIPFIRDPEHYYSGKLRRVMPADIYERPSPGLWSAEDIIGPEYEEFWWRGDLFATHHVASAHGPNSGWDSEKTRVWRSAILEYLGWDPVSYDRYLQLGE